MGVDDQGSSSREEVAPADSAARDVFVSYASADAGVANQLVEHLEHAGVTCWIAPRDVIPGAHYAEEIIRGINEAKVLVLVLSSHSVKSAHVGKEVERASSKRRPIIAIRMDTTPLPPALEYFLSESQWVEVGGGGIGTAAAKVIAAIPRQPVPTGGTTASHSPTLAPSQSVPSKRWLTLAGVAAIAVVGLIASRVWNQKPSASAAVSAPAAAASAPALTPVSEKSIAVLPFVDMSEKKDQEYFSDGLAEELIDHLAHIQELKVIARTSSFAFKGKNEDMRSIASKLGVANLLEGSVRKAGGQLRITAQLIRASDGVHLWSETYDRKLDDIFKVQDEISTTVAKALKVALGGNGIASVMPSSRGTTNIEAYNRYLQGKYFYDRGNPGDTTRAIGLFQQAVQLDPQYTLAWTSLAESYAWQGYAGELAAGEAIEKGLAAAEHALKIDANSAAAYHARAQVLRQVSGDWTSAKSDYLRARALASKGDTEDRAKRSIFEISASTTGEFDPAIGYIRDSLQKNPLNFSALFDLAYLLQYDGRLEESTHAYLNLLDKNPDYSSTHAFYAITLLLMKKGGDALAEAQKESDPAYKLWALACIYSDMGRRPESDAALATLEHQYATQNMYLIGAVHAYRGEAALAMTWLNRAYQQRRGSLETLKYDPLFSKMRSDPRFIQLLKQSGLGDYESATGGASAPKASSS